MFKVCVSTMETWSKTFPYIQHFNYQLMHTTLKNVELLKHSKISKLKHVGAVLHILECVSNSTFFNFVCVSW